jgi:hypothetical protein
MGEDCSTYGGQKRCIQGFRWEELTERDHLEELGLDGSRVLNWIFRKCDEGQGLNCCGS